MNYRPLVLRAFCLWTLFVWSVLIRNMILDTEHGFGFRAVHIGLALVSIALAAVVWPFAKRLASAKPSDSAFSSDLDVSR